MSRGAALSLTAGVVAFAIVTTLVGMASGAPPEFLATDLLMGSTFIVAGITAAWNRPRSPAGPLLLVSGALWFIGSYAPSLQPVVMHLGFAFESYYDLVLAALLLMLSTPLELRPRWLILGLAGAMLVRSLGRLLFADPALLGCDLCPPNPFAIVPSVAAFETVEVLSSLAIAGLAVAVGVVGILRLAGSGPVARRARWPVAVAGGIAMTAAAYDAFEYAWTTGTHGPLIRVDDPWAGLFSWALFGARVLVPIGFLVGVLRARAEPGPIGRFAAGLEAADEKVSLADAVRTALGDPSLLLLRPAPGGKWLAEDDSIVALPSGPGSGVTIVGPREEPLAAIRHDPALLEQPELLEAVVRVLRLALDNERLQAQLREQLRAVTESRARIVTASEEERRRVERDLHDGAQQRLIAVSLALQRARSSANQEAVSSDLRRQLGAAADEIGEAIRELRELARGIHPAILEDAGLEAAIGGLARRAGIPVEVAVRLDGRLPRLVESTAYFTVAEALTNAQRHAGATHATVCLERTEDRLVLEVRDDGRGGADPGRGTGLRGLADRIAAIGGQLEVDSEEGIGTRLRAMLPTG